LHYSFHLVIEPDPSSLQHFQAHLIRHLHLVVTAWLGTIITTVDDLNQSTESQLTWTDVVGGQSTFDSLFSPHHPCLTPPLRGTR